MTRILDMATARLQIEVASLRQSYADVRDECARLERAADTSRQAATAAQTSERIARGVASTAMREIGRQAAYIAHLERQLAAAIHGTVVIDAACVEHSARTAVRS